MSSIISISPIRSAPAAASQAQIAYRRYELKPVQSAALSCNVVLAHATGLCKEVYTQFLGHLKTIEGEVIAGDMRNHGDSWMANRELFERGEAWPETCIDGAGDILALLDHIKLDSSKPLIGIGHSIGATNL
jgi:pimeloyl-ACP methyl ester carboxylesterase